MRIFHLHLGYGQCNCGDKWLAAGAKNLMVENLGVQLKDIYERDIYMKDGVEPSWDELIELINNNDYDLVFIGGGGWLGDSSPLWWGKPWKWYNKLKVPYIVYGIGYNTSRCIKLPKESLIQQIENLKGIQRKAIFFAVRMDGSKETLENIGLEFKTAECPHSAFYIKKDNRDRIIKGDYVILNIAGDGIFHRYDCNKITSEAFCEKIKIIINFILEKGYKVYFAKHVPSDGLCFNFIDWNPEIVRILDWKEMLSNGLNYYQYAKMVIGMRGHTQVVPISLGTPTISISTADKNTELMAKLGLSKYNIEVNDPLLIEKIKVLISEVENNPTELIKYYDDKLGEMRKITKENFDVISQKLKKIEVIKELQKMAGEYNLSRGPYDEDYNEQYGMLDYNDKVVLDIGADYGSTALFFLRNGAKKVIGIETNKDYFYILNKIGKRVKEIVPIEFKIECGYNISNLIKDYSPDIVKMDCDGCEVFILQMVDGDIRLVKDWVIELHTINVYNFIKELFIKNGFEVKYSKMDSVSQWAWIVWFSRRD